MSGVGLWTELDDRQENAPLKSMFILRHLLLPLSHVHANCLPWLLAQRQDVVFPIYNRSAKATVYLKSLQTEMIGILKVSFAGFFFFTHALKINRSSPLYCQ